MQWSQHQFCQPAAMARGPHPECRACNLSICIPCIRADDGQMPLTERVMSTGKLFGMTGGLSSITVANRWRAPSADDGQTVGQRAFSAPRLSLPSGSADGFLCRGLWALPEPAGVVATQHGPATEQTLGFPNQPQVVTCVSGTTAQSPCEKTGFDLVRARCRQVWKRSRGVLPWDPASQSAADGAPSPQGWCAD